MTCTGVPEPHGFSRSCAAAKAKTPPTRTTTQSVPRWSSECSASCHVQHRARVGRTTVQDAAAMNYAFGFPIQYRGPEPNLATRSPGLASLQRSNDRHPHPMHWVSPCLRRSSSAMRSLMRLLQFPESLAQSALSGTRFLKRQPDLLSKYDERDPAENRARVARWPRPDRSDVTSPLSS